MEALKVTEIRIGNFFTYIEKQYQVDALFFRFWEEHRPHMPIPLSAEWLEKFKFSAKGYKPGYIGKDFKSGTMILDFVLDEPFFKGDWQDYYAFDLGDHRFVPVHYVHQLQNLYFAITQQELTID